jgi:hypothetical protein
MEAPAKPKRVKINIVIDPGVKAAIVEVAASQGRSTSWIVTKAITDYLQGLRSRSPLNLRREGKPG